MLALNVVRISEDQWQLILSALSAANVAWSVFLTLSVLTALVLGVLFSVLLGHK